MSIRVWEHMGYPCIVAANHEGFMCGYVALPEEHPLYEVAYDDIDVDVHGGLTYAAPLSNWEAENDEKLMSVIKDGESYWKVGFDCAHDGDLPNPEHARSAREGRAYAENWGRFLMPSHITESEHGWRAWTVEETAGETERLAEQLSRLAEKQQPPPLERSDEG